MKIERIKDFIKRITKEMKEFGQLCRDNHLDSHSAAAAFFIFVSIIPVIILILSIIPYTPLTDESLYGALSYFLPEEMSYFTTYLISQLNGSSITILSISVITAIWTASRSVFTIKRGLDDINKCSVNEGNLFFLRLKSILQMVIFLVVMLGVLAINALLETIDLLFEKVFNVCISDTFSFAKLIYTFKPIIILVITFASILYLFVVLPSENKSIKSQIPGAIITSLSWFLFSRLFSLYITNYNAYSMYGSLTAIIINLIWLYACMYFMFLGAEFNYYLSLKRENCKI